MANSRTRAITRPCCVKACRNMAEPGHRSCGKHNSKRRAERAAGQRTRYVRLDSRVPDLLVDLVPVNTADDEVTIEVRDNGTVIGLPTSRPQLIDFLQQWLGQPDHTLDLLERLTPPVLHPSPLMANAYCQVSDSLMRYDLGAQTDNPDDALQAACHGAGVRQWKWYRARGM